MLVGVAACQNDLGKVQASVTAQRCPEVQPAPMAEARKFEAEEFCFFGPPFLVLGQVIVTESKVSDESTQSNRLGRTLWSFTCNPKGGTCDGAAMSLNSIDRGLGLSRLELQPHSDMKIRSNVGGVLAIAVSGREHLTVDFNTGAVSYFRKRDPSLASLGGPSSTDVRGSGSCTAQNREAPAR